MLELEVPTLSMRSITLEPNTQTKKGVPKSQPSLDNQVQLADPLVRLIMSDSAGNDQELIEFLKGEAGKFSYYRVHLGCTFQSDQSYSFEQAKLEVTLKRTDGVPDPHPIAWSMLPQRDSDIVTETKSIKLTGSLQLIGVEVDNASTIPVQEEFVVSMYQQTAHPCWMFSETESRRIFGFYPCTLIVRAPYGVTVQGSVGLSTFVRRMALKIIPYRAVGPDGGAPLSFTFADGAAS